MNTEEAMDTLKQAFQDDPEYAYGWHANIAMAVYDESSDEMTSKEARSVGNRAASRFMKLAFDVETSQTMLDKWDVTI